MQPYKLISGLVWVAFTCGVCPVTSSVDSNNVDSNQDINRRQGLIYSQNKQHPYQHYSPSQGNEYASIKVLDQRISSKDYDAEYDDQDGTGSFTSDALDRQDAFGTDIMSMVSFGLAAFAAGAATFALIQNAQQATDIDDDNTKIDALTTRVSSLESDQTNICTTVKAFGNANSGFTIDDTVVTNNALEEAGFINALANIGSPTCS